MTRGYEQPTKAASETDGLRVKFDSAILYALVAALIGFVVRVESHGSSTDTRLVQLERRTDTLEVDLKAIKESLYEIRSDVKILIKGATK
jgi:pyruvate-formate lyase-activating enzyme